MNNGGGIGWTIHEGPDPCGLFDGNLTGGAGPFALVNSHCEGEVSEDTELVTPSVDLSAPLERPDPFRSGLQRRLSRFRGDRRRGHLDRRGRVLDNVLHQTEAVAGPNTQSIDVTALAAGQADVRARFHYYNAFAALWWQVDDVILGETSACRSRAGSSSGTSSTRTPAWA